MLTGLPVPSPSGSAPMTGHDFGAFLVGVSSPSFTFTVNNTGGVATGNLVVGVTGIGGFFFRAQEPQTLAAWYAEHLGVGAGEYGSWDQQAGQTLFTPDGLRNLATDVGATFLRQVQSKAEGYSALWSVAALFLAAFGSGPLSVDRTIVKREF